MDAVILRTAQATASTVTDALPTKNVQLAASMDVGDVLRVIIVLVLIIAGAYLLTRYIAQRSLRQGMKQQSRRPKGSASSQYPELGRLVSVADRIAVDRDKTLMVVEFEGRYYLLGTTSDGFQRLAEAEIPPEAQQQDEEIPQERNAPADDGNTFGQRFRKAFGVVLRSYLPGGMRQEAARRSSFDEQLKARIRADSQAAGNKQGSPADAQKAEKETDTAIKPEQTASSFHARTVESETEEIPETESAPKDTGTEELNEESGPEAR